MSSRRDLVTSTSEGVLRCARVYFQPATTPARLFTTATILALTVALLIYFMDGRHPSVIYRTDKGGTCTVPFPRGGSIILNADSEIYASSSGHLRQVILTRGEALITIPPDVETSTQIMAGNTTVRAIGATFDIELRSQNALDIAVTHGSVSIDSPSKIILSQGYYAQVRDRMVSVDSNDDISRTVSWTYGRLEFDDEPMSQIVERFNRINRSQLVIIDPVLAKQRFTGIYNAYDPYGFAVMLEPMGVTRDVIQETSGTVILLSRKRDHASSGALLDRPGG